MLVLEKLSIHSTVKSFRTTFVENRFMPPISILGIIVMRFALFCATDMPRPLSRGDSHLWEPLSQFFARSPVSAIASTCSVLLIALLLALISDRFNLLRTRSVLPFTTPLLLLSLHPSSLAMSGDYISIILILLALYPFLESYQNPDNRLSSFQASVLIALASLFQIRALVLIPLWWSGERLMRTLRFRAIVSSLFGVFLVYVTLFSVCCFLDDIPGFIQPFLHSFDLSLKPEIIPPSVLDAGGLLLTGLLFLSGSILSVRIYLRDRILALLTMRFTIILIITLLLLHILYRNETRFFLLLSLTLISFQNAYLYTKTTSKIHIYLAYGMVSLMLFFWLLHILPR
ncbi:MAG: hypothetical protein LBH72_04000 [Proteiniphilum sp.]|jgi:hypothetical protein|nr:hypothetical protein [Proteiniphilum sp.]